MDEVLNEFIGETREGLEALDSQLVRFEQSPDNPELLGEIFRLIHTIKGTSGFIGLMRLQAVAHAAETLLGGFRDGSAAVTSDGVTAVLRAVDVIRGVVDGLAATGAEPGGDDEALIQRLEALAREGGGADPIPTVQQPAPSDHRPLLERVGGEATLDVVGELIVANGRAFGDVASTIEPLVLQGAIRDHLTAAARDLPAPGLLFEHLTLLAPHYSPAEALGMVIEAAAIELAGLGVEAPHIEMLALRAVRGLPAIETPPAAETVAPAPEPVAAPAPQPNAAPAETEAQGAQTIRVGVDALEHLMTVASELVLIRNQLLQLLRLDPECAFAAPLHRLNQVTSELQESVMTTRMQPISGAWAKLPRVVRDLAAELGKKIDLVMQGQDTELDRQVLELIKDPLTHMIRNSADHGLETPEERLAAGKSATGRILLSARHEGGAIVIEISDDGRGLPARKIRDKAVATGVVTQAQADAMSDAEARRLIFLPGFSTASKVTAVSGRGVGMDVVRTNIEKIGGVIELNSVEGQGSQFTIRIPLTLTIVSALIVECCGERFAMPQSSVVELVSASEASARNIEYIDDTAVLRLRDRLLPLVSLQALLGLPVEDVRSGETCIVVAKVGASTFGVIVDRVFDTEEIVVKPVASVLRHVKAYCGATILGDGSVIMIIDFKGLAPEAAVDGAATGEAEAAATEREALEALLVFRMGGEALKGAPLARVARIEEVTASQIERVDRRDVIQYRGKLMPVVGATQDLDRTRTTAQPLLVFTRDERSVGLLVDEIIDIAESAVIADLASSGGASLGSLIIGGEATELIDIDHYWREAFLEDAPVVRSASQDRRRLLVLDRSPFCRVLLQPLLSKAGYDVTVAASPDQAIELHDEGDEFDLIMVDTTARGEDARRLAEALFQADRWHATPVISLAQHRINDGEAVDEAQLLNSLSETLGEDMRGAA